MFLPQTTATLKVFDNYITAYLDPQIGDYYRRLLPRYKNIQPPKYQSHISVVRYFEGYNDSSKRFDNSKVVVWYEPIINYKFPYYFLRAWSEDIEEIRESLGLPRIRKGYSCYHITIGNTKNDFN